MVKWIFFDIGSTLVDETEAYDHRVRDMIVGTDISFSEFDDVRIAFAKQGLDGNSAVIKSPESLSAWRLVDCGCFLM